MTNNSETGANTTPAASVFGDRDVSDIQGSIRVLNTEVEHLKQNKADSKELEKLRGDWFKTALFILVPLLASSLGALAILFTGLLSG